MIDVPRSTIPRPTDRQVWLAGRRPYFNASAASVLWDRHPFQSAADYAVEKLIGSGQTETRAMRRGRYLEQSLADWYEHETGEFLFEPEIMYIGGPVLANVDRLVLNGPTDRVVEIKTSKGYLSEPEQSWVDQTQAQMMCTGIDHATVVWLDASMDMHDVELDADEAFQVELVRRAEKFMAAIELGMVPDWITPELSAKQVAAVHPNPEGEIELSAELVEQVNDYRDARAIRRAADDRMDRIRDEVARALGDHEVGVYEGVEIVSFRAVKDSYKLNVPELRADHPDLVEKYQMVVPNGRRFLPVGN